MNQKGFVQYLLILLLLIGIGVSVYLIQFTQIFKPKASETNTDASSPFSGRYGSMPLAELSKYQRPANHIQAYLFLAFNGKSQLMQLSTPVLNYLDYYIFSLINFVPGPNGRTLDWVEFDAIPQELKDINPQLKVGTMIHGSTAISPELPTWQALSNSDFFHYPDGQPIVFSGSGFEAYRYINIASDATRLKIAQFWKNKVIDEKYNLLLIDSYDSWEKKPEFANGCLEGDCKNRLWWFDYLNLTSQTIGSTVPIGTDLTFNGLGPDKLEPSYSGLDYTTGAFSERPEIILNNKQYFKGYLDGYQYAINKGKKVFFYANPQFLCPNTACPNNQIQINDQGTIINAANDLNMERFFLAFYLLFQSNPLTYFTYSPGPPYMGAVEGDGGVYYYKDWLLDFGTPLANWANHGSLDLYVRQYTNGYAVVNSSAQPLPIELPPGQVFKEWDPANGLQVSGTVMIPPKSGKFYFFPNNPANSPSPVTKAGDIDNDGDVDIFDFNTFVTDFPLKNLRSDLDGNGKVDIFDFNLLVQNFGK